ncbi:helix-turn-helix DNA binding protein [Gordonia phage Wocket]|nr:helix-turn-helix DNA binding protein [Gordonia phage Wocket]
MTDDDRALLDFAAHRWNYAGNQAEAVRTEFGISVTRFWQRVNNLLDDPAAIEHAPALVNRLRRIRSRRR